MEAIERNISSMDWIGILLLLSLTLLAVTRSFFGIRFGDFVMLFATNKYMMVKGKDHNVFHPFNLLLFIVNIISVSLFAYVCILHFFEPEKEGFLLYAQIATGYAFIILAKFSIEKIISNIFSIDEMIDYYLFHKLSYRNFLAMFLLPISIVFIYGWWPTSLVLSIITGLIVLANVIVLISFYFKIQKEIFHRWFYFIVYLCALEIAPYIILYKLFMS